MEIAKLYKILKSRNMLFGKHQVLETGAQQQGRALVGHASIEAKWDFLAKLMIFGQQDATEGIQPQQH